MKKTDLEDIVYENGIIPKFEGQYRWLSNMVSIKPFRVDNIPYTSVENYYQAAKSDNVGIKYKISKLNAYESKKYGSKISVREGWDGIKDDVMKHGLNIKFSRNNLKNSLVNTKNMYIQEGNTWGDTYWGFCLKTNKGQNRLGVYIMEIREKIYNELKEESKNYLLKSDGNLKKLLDLYGDKGHNKYAWHAHQEITLQNYLNYFFTDMKVIEDTYFLLDEQTKDVLDKIEDENDNSLTKDMLLKGNFDNIVISNTLQSFLECYIKVLDKNSKLVLF